MPIRLIKFKQSGSLKSLQHQVHFVCSVESKILKDLQIFLPEKDRNNKIVRTLGMTTKAHSDTRKTTGKLNLIRIKMFVLQRHH